MDELTPTPSEETIPAPVEELTPEPVVQSEYELKMLKWVFGRPKTAELSKERKAKISDMASQSPEGYAVLVEKVENMIMDNIEKMRDYKQCPNDYELRAAQLLDMSLSSLRTFLMSCQK